MRTPFSLGDELLLYRDRPDEPQTAGYELRVSGAIDEERLRDALATAIAVHPMSRARWATRRWLLRPPQWEIQNASEIDLKAVVHTVQADNDSELSVIRSKFYSRPVSLRQPPALRFLLVKRSGGDSLMFKWHHAFTDGVGGLRFLYSVARAYASEPDPIPDIDPIAARDLGVKPVEGSRSALDDEDDRPRPTGLPAAVAPDRAVAQPGYGLCYLNLPVQEIRRPNLEGLARVPTINDLLLAALHMTVDEWNTAHGRSSGRILILVPINTRPIAWRHEIVGNLVRSETIVTTAEHRADPHLLLETITEQTRYIRSRATAARPLRPAWIWRLFPLLVRLRDVPVIRNRPLFSALLSNVGRLRNVPQFGAAGEVTEFWGSTPAVMPQGLGVGAVRLNDRLHLSVRYRRALLDDKAGQRFAQMLLSQLTGHEGACSQEHQSA